MLPGCVLHFLYALDKLLHCLVKLDIGSPVLGNLLVGVKHRGMVPAAKKFANLRQGSIRQLPAEVHGNLPRYRKIFVSLAGIQVINIQLEVGGNHLTDDFQGDFLGGIVRENILQ